MTSGLDDSTGDVDPASLIYKTDAGKRWAYHNVYVNCKMQSQKQDMFMTLDKNDQKIYVVPSKNMVIIRMDDVADDVNLTLSDFDKTL